MEQCERQCREQDRGLLTVSAQSADELFAEHPFLKDRCADYQEHHIPDVDLRDDVRKVVVRPSS